MPFERDGFLGEEARRMAKEILKAHSELLALVREINRLAQQSTTEFKIDALDKRELLASCLFARIIEGAQAALILIERGLDLDATIILRSVFEALVHLKLSVEDPGYVERYLLYFEGKRRTLLKNLLRHDRGALRFLDEESGGEESGGPVKIDEEIKRIDALFAERKTDRDALRREFSIRNLSKKAGMTGLYKSFYVVTSDYVHTNASALERFVERTDGGGITRISYGPTDINARINLVCAAELILSTLQTAFKLFNIDREQEIKEFQARLEALAP